MTGPPSHATGRLVLRDVTLGAADAPLDLVVAAGEVVALITWNSSEVFWAVAGLGPVTSGQILVDGCPITDHEAALAAGVVLIPQGSALASLLTAFENVLLPLAERRRVRRPSARATGQPPDQKADVAVAARRALADVGLADSGDHLVEELSGGQQQRVAVARAIAGRPRLLLADQATTDLDPANRTRMVGLLRELAAAGTAVLLASDDPAVRAACDRSVTLDTQTGPSPTSSDA